MKTHDRDSQSYFAIINSFLKQAELEEEQYNLLTSELRRFLKLKFEQGGYVHPIITKFCTDWYREFYRLIDYKDPYKNLKNQSNEEAMSILPNLTVKSFRDTINISIKGNQLDFGAVLVLNPDLNKLKEEFEKVHELQLTIDDTQKLEEAIDKADSVLFLTDNAGEIIFDIPLLEHLNKKFPKNKITIAAKDTPMLNDVTIGELRELGTDKYGKLMPIGSNCFGLHEEDVSNEFKKILKASPLIIAKGQAYLEFFTEYDFDNVFILTRVKYPIINEALGKLEPHQNVVIDSKRFCHTGTPYNYKGINPKIIGRTEAKDTAEKLKREGKTIVTTNGAFDILHVGHIKALQEAKNQGDILFVAVNSDSSVKQYKSPLRPINNQEHRVEMLAALECIDYIFTIDETVPMPYLEEIKPNVHCNASAYGEDCIEFETVKRNGGRLHILSDVAGFSSSKMIEKMMDVHLKEKRQKDIETTAETSRDKIISVIEKQQGILFAKPAAVHRSTYSGRDIIAKNSKFEEGYIDQRGYVPVEWWIMSLTQAENEIMKEGEGLTEIKIESKFIPLHDIASLAEEKIFGKYMGSWPLTKILDIGGTPVTPSFSNEPEVPPIPTHVHSGIVKDGIIQPPGKLEAYFFPPVNIPPYNQEFGKVITRLGLKSNTTREELKQALMQFGKDDSTYQLCNPYEINPYDGWAIPAGIVHAPGPWVTFEIQLPQDDFNLLGWQLGQRFKEEELEQKRQELQLRGLKDEDDLISQAIDWNASTHPEFKKNYYRPSRIIEQGIWGRRLQIFFDEFYGEAIEIEPGQEFRRNADERPYAGIVWGGQGTINDNSLDVNNKEQKEFLVTPNSECKIKNTNSSKLLIYTVFPIKN